MAVEQRIQRLEQQQQTLEKGLKNHHQDILQLRQEYKQGLLAEPAIPEQTQKPKSKITPSPQPVAPPQQKEQEKPVSLLDNLKIPEHLSKEATKPKTPPKPKRSLLAMEQDFGKVWFVRLGIISLLTGLVFLSNFAYKNFIIEWGAGARLGGMYFLAALLLGLGTYFEKAKAALSNYGKVLAAGGIATLYYTSYAAHHVERLRVIDSPLLGGMLLTASAAACLTYALWKRSNVTAMCSILLAYYSTSINPVGAFSLVSGLLLTLTGLILLHRLRSASIGFVSMIGAYASFIYWQVFVNHGATNYEYASWFIVGYWLLSTASILIPRTTRDQPFDKTQLLAFASINNAFLVLLMSLDLHSLYWTEPLWPVSAIIGSVFILIALFLKYGDKFHSKVSSIPYRTSLSSLFIMKGIALITLALCLKLTGPSLALSLTIQAALLLIASCRAEGAQRNYFITAFFLVLLLGFSIYLAIMSVNLVEFTLTHLVMAALYLAISLIAQFGISHSDKSKPMLTGIPSVFSIIAIACCISFAQIPVFSKISLFFGLNLGLTLYQYLSNKKNILPDFCIFSHAFSAIAVTFVLQYLADLNSLQLFTITLALYSATAINLYTHSRDKKQTQYTAYLLAATASLIISLISTESISATLLITSLIPLGYHAFYQRFIEHKLRFIAILGFIIYPLVWLGYLVSYIIHFFDVHPLIHLIIAIIPLIHLWFIKQKHLSPFKFMAPPLTIASAIMITIWQVVYIDTWQLSLALTAAIYHLLDQKENKLLTLIAAILYAISIYQANITYPLNQTIINTIALIPMAVYFTRRFMLTRSPSTQPAYYTIMQRGVAILASLTVWIISSQHLISHYDSSALSIVWAIVGLIILSIGFISKDIIFRTMAFIILGCTILHVFGVDVWKLNALLRIISFITLGIVLLIIGYLYCRKVDQTETSPESTQTPEEE